MLWGGIVIITALAWIYLIIMPMGAQSWLLDATLMFLMWAVMMVAMMLPSAAPMLSTYARIAARRAKATRAYHVWMFATGYFVVWTAFSLRRNGAAVCAAERRDRIQRSANTTWIASAIILVVGGNLSAHPAEKRMPQVVPHTDRIFHDQLARRRGAAHSKWALSMAVLHRMLLDADGTAVRRGSDESGVGRGD